MRRLGISFLKREPTQILIKDYTASLLLLTILYLTASENNKSVFLSYKNGIYILRINPQLLFYKDDIINTRLLKN